MKFLKYKKGTLSAGKMITLFVALLIVSALIGTVITTLTQTAGNFTGVSLTLWNLLPMAIVLAIFLAVLAVAGFKMAGK